jgi:TolB-like protein/class 3 adenylate cyclase
MSTDTTRKLATIVALDVAGYSARTEADEAKTTAEVATLRKVIEAIAARHGGRVFNTAGDGFMLEFGSSLGAVEAAFALAETCEPKVRVGVHLCDVVVQPNGDLLGHGVNVAARLMAKSEPGGALVSAAVRQTIRGPVVERLISCGLMQLDKMAETIEAFALAGIAASLSPQPAPTPAAAQPTKPSIAVLPFANLSNDPQQAYFTDGMMEEITTALSRIRSIFVIASASTQQYKDKPVSAQIVGRDLGVRYVLEGSVRKAANRIRIAVKLIAAADGAQIWAERYDDTLDDVFALQDRVALSVAGVIEPTVRDAEMRRAARRPTTNIDAYDLYLKAVALVDTYEKDAMFEALILLERALALDPRYAQALSVAGYAHSQIFVSRWAEDLAHHRRLALDHASRGVQLAADDADVLSWIATVYLALDEDAAMSTALIDRSLALNPGSSLAWMMSAWLRAAAGDADVAVEHMETSIRLNPCSSDRGHQLSGIALARFDQRRFDEAVRLLKESTQLQPAVSFNLALLAASHGHLGDMKAAADALTHYKRLSTIDVENRTTLFRRPEHRDLFLEGIARARGTAS